MIGDFMTVRIYLSNLSLYVEGKENGRWLQLPMDSNKLQYFYHEIVGYNQEHIILDYNAVFKIHEYEDVFKLNEILEEILGYNLEENELKALFKIGLDRDEIFGALINGSFDIIDVNEVSAGWNSSLIPEEIYGMVLNEVGYNNLFSQPIPEEMIDYINFEQIYTCLSINDGWQPVEVDKTTYLVRIY